MRIERVLTADGSSSLALVGQNEQYHSKHGALQEAQHVYIKSGLDFYLQEHQKSNVHILEVGFGTGLNSLLSFLYAQNQKVQINYTSFETHSLSWDDVKDLNYPELLSISVDDFKSLHDLPWGDYFPYKPNCQLRKINDRLQSISFENEFDVVFFDAFGPRTQPAIWEKSVFQKVYTSMKNNAVLVTYSANGQARRNMLAAGFEVGKIPGPPGKREMLRAVKR